MPIQKGYRPNHNFGGPNDVLMYMGSLEFIESPSISPGESTDVLVHFITAPGLQELVQVGREWRIQEGRKLQGYATVLQVLPSA